MELYWAGKKHEAFDMFGRVHAFATMPGATGYMMVARGVFKDTTKSRPQPMEPEARPAGGGGGGRGGRAGPLSDAQKESIRKSMDEFLKPYMRA
jgi:hypothetical protein